MPRYQFKAIDAEGQIVEGAQDAAGEEEVVRRIQDAGQIPLEVSPERRGLRIPGLGRRRGRKLDHRQISSFARSLSTMLKAGMPLDRSLQSLAGVAETPAQAALLERLLDRVRGGRALSDAMDDEGEAFSRFHISMVRSGEVGGALADVLARIAEYAERAQALRETVVSALIYPAILVILSVGSVMVLLAYVVPQFTELFEGAGEALPMMTRVTIGAAEILRDYWWWLLLGLLVFLIAMQGMLESPRYRRHLDRLLLRLPRVRELVSGLELARFARTLSTLLANGVPLLQALGIVRETLRNQVLAEDIAEVEAQLREGGRMADLLIEQNHLPKLGVQLVRLGEETGQLDDMLGRVADIYDEEVQRSVKRLLAVLEPVLIIVLGVLVAGIIMSILVAILGIHGLAF